MAPWPFESKRHDHRKLGKAPHQPFIEACGVGEDDVRDGPVLDIQVSDVARGELHLRLFFLASRCHTSSRTEKEVGA